MAGEHMLREPYVPEVPFPPMALHDAPELDEPSREQA
jgi:hypothetical protein